MASVTKMVAAVADRNCFHSYFDYYSDYSDFVAVVVVAAGKTFVIGVVVVAAVDMEFDYSADYSTMERAVATRA